MNQLMGSPRGLVVVLPAVVFESVVSGSCEALPAGLTDVFSSAVVLVVGSEVADRFVQPHGVVLDPNAGQLVLQDGGVADVFEVGPLAL